MNGNLLIKKIQDQSLDAFVAGLSDVIGGGAWEERQSSNYVEERYFRCFVLGLTITAAIADSSEFNTYDFWLSIEPEAGGVDRSFLDGLADSVARKLAIHGYEVIRPYDFAHSGTGGLCYRLNPTAGAKPRARVITEEI